MNSVSDIYLFSSLSFSVYFVFKSRMCNLTFEFILHLYSCFVLFYPPVEGLCCRPKYWANIVRRFDDQNSLTSNCIENWALFERPTHSQRSALSVSTGGAGGVPNAKPSRKPALFRPVQGWVYKHLPPPGPTYHDSVYIATGSARKG